MQQNINIRFKHYQFFYLLKNIKVSSIFFVLSLIYVYGILLLKIKVTTTTSILTFWNESIKNL